MDNQILLSLEVFFTQFKCQLYKPHDILIHEDEEPPCIFYIKSGVVKEYTISKHGSEVVVNLYKEHSFFPMSWAMNGTPNSYFFEAVTHVEASRASKEKVLEFVKANPLVLYDLLRRVFAGTDGLLMRLTYLMAGSAYARLITELIIYVKRFGVNGKNSMPVEIKVWEKDLAAQTGMSRETVSREMKRLKDKRLIVFKNNLLQIPDFKKLEEELMS